MTWVLSSIPLEEIIISTLSRWTIFSTYGFFLIISFRVQTCLRVGVVDIKSMSKSWLFILEFRISTLCWATNQREEPVRDREPDPELPLK